MSIVENLDVSGNPGLGIALLALAAFRVYLEVIQFDLTQLPLTQVLARSKGEKGEESVRRFHRLGLYFSVGYILFFAPGVLLA